MWACVCLRLICRGISIRIDLQQAFSSDIEIHFLCGSENGGWKHVGSQRACFLATCLSQYGKLTVLWCWSQMVCMWVCDWGGKEGWLCEGGERGRKERAERRREGGNESNSKTFKETFSSKLPFGCCFWNQEHKCFPLYQPSLFFLPETVWVG